jgi:CBS domain-containing protein
MFVNEVMTQWPVTVHRSTTVKEALRLLDRHKITSMPVVEGDGRIVGMISEADLLRDGVPHDTRAHLAHIPEEHLHPASTVAEVMSQHPVVVHSNDDIADAVELMTSTAVKSLPVVDSKHRPVGMISRRDVVHRLARSDELVAAEIDDLFRQLGVDWAVSVDQGKVTVEGPAGEKARALAEAAVLAVAGVRSVHVAEPGSLGAQP